MGSAGGTIARAESALRTLLPALSGVPVQHAWGGPIDVSSDRLPFFATLPGTRVHYGAGFTGNGVGPSWLGGQILASLAAGADDRWTNLPLVTRRVPPRLPPEPLRSIGQAIVSRALLAIDDAEAMGVNGLRPPRGQSQRSRDCSGCASRAAELSDSSVLRSASSLAEPGDLCLVALAVRLCLDDDPAQRVELRAQ